MYKKIYSLHTFVIICCLAISSIIPISLSDHYDALSRVGLVFPFNLDNNKTNIYSMGLLKYSYKTIDLKFNANQDSNLVEILIPKASLTISFGTSRPYNRKYNINSKGMVLIIETRGTATLSPDGKHAKNCQFIFTESKNSKNNQIKEAVKEGLLKELQRSLAEELCDKIKFQENKFLINEFV